jgi:hypothetical protein
LLQFEIESLELRHWPLHPEIEVVARELLALVCHAKERVLFALALFFKMVQLYYFIIFLINLCLLDFIHIGYSIT